MHMCIRLTHARVWRVYGMYSSKAQLAEHTARADAWMSIGGKVYNISGYLEDHPGGGEVLMDLAGTDGTEEFEDVGHSSVARKALLALEVGELPPSERAGGGAKDAGGASGGGAAVMLLPVLTVALAAAAVGSLLQ